MGLKNTSPNYTSGRERKAERKERLSKYEHEK